MNILNLSIIKIVITQTNNFINCKKNKFKFCQSVKLRQKSVIIPNILDDCPMWSSWENLGTCSKSCGKGVLTLKRVCKGGDIDECEGESLKIEPCNDVTCPSKFINNLISLNI